MTDKFNLNRFLEAQSSSYNIALLEIKNGRKSNHWMRFFLRCLLTNDSRQIDKSCTYRPRFR